MPNSPKLNIATFVDGELAEQTLFFFLNPVLNLSNPT